MGRREAAVQRPFVASARVLVALWLWHALLMGCAPRPSQERFLRIDGLPVVATELPRPESWDHDEDAAWMRNQMKGAGEHSHGLSIIVERADPDFPGAYLAVAVTGSAQGGSLAVTRPYVISQLLHWTEVEQRELGGVPDLANLSIQLSAEECATVERALLRLSPELCTDTVAFFPERERIYHVEVRVRDKTSRFSVFAPALSELERQAQESITYLAEYDKLSRRESDVVALVLEFADKKLLEHFAVGPRPVSQDDGAYPGGFGSISDDEPD
jgi:hypothetical protein